MDLIRDEKKLEPTEGWLAWLTGRLRTTPNQWFDQTGNIQEKEGSAEPSNFDLFYDLVLVVAYQTIGPQLLPFLYLFCRERFQSY